MSKILIQAPFEDFEISSQYVSPLSKALSDLDRRRMSIGSNMTVSKHELIAIQNYCIAVRQGLLEVELYAEEIKRQMNEHLAGRKLA